jgi:glycerophosphoryl diester phosphodiesterase
MRKIFDARAAAICFFMLLTVHATLTQAATANTAGQAIVIAHRGASGYLPEHTLEAYALAYGQGADYIEPDLVMTKDGVLIAMHDIHLERTTDVAQVFPDRKREDGRYYAADFTLEEIKRLRVLEAYPQRFPRNAAQFAIPTFEEVIALVQGLNHTTGRTVGIYPELKEPSWHEKEGLPMERPFMTLLNKYDLNRPDAPIFVQCFEPNTLKRLRTEHQCKAPMIVLVGEEKEFDSWVTTDGLAEIATYAQGIGPDKVRVLFDNALVSRAHAAGLKVHIYTLRRELVPTRFASFDEEVKYYFFEVGVDGAFTDFPDIVVRLVHPSYR